MPDKTYHVGLCYSGYIEFDDVQAADDAEAVAKAEAMVEAIPFPHARIPDSLERWRDADMIEEVNPC